MNTDIFSIAYTWPDRIEHVLYFVKQDDKIYFLEPKEILPLTDKPRKPIQRYD